MAYAILQDENGDKYAIYHDYHIYRDGRIYSTKRGRFLKGGKRNGIKLIGLAIDNSAITYTLKRLIYHIFVDNNIPPIGDTDYVFICKDGNEDNVSADNLQIYTREEYTSIINTGRVITYDDNNRYTINNAQTDYDIHIDDIGKYVEYEGYYVYDNGTVLKPGPTPTMMYGFMAPEGFKRIELSINGKKKRYAFKKLVAHCFIYSAMPPSGNTKYKVLCNDGNEDNVSADNLTVVFK